MFFQLNNTSLLGFLTFQALPEGLGGPENVKTQNNALLAFLR